jgi:dinuclear metal center YbgI/SA1388 family protein
MAHRDQVVGFLDELLNVRGIEDRSANGLQVAGGEEISRVGLATDAALATYRRAAELGCQLLLVHHGLIWGGITAVTGRVREHLAFLLAHDLNLYAAHLPLDLHPEVGNNAELARIIGLAELAPFGDYHGRPIGFQGRLATPLKLAHLAARFAGRLGGEPATLAFGPPLVQAIGIVSGGGSSTLEEAIERRLDCLVTGEGTHPDHHAALEGRINVLYLGHYRSETVGVRAVGRKLSEQFGVETVFIDEPTGF